MSSLFSEPTLSGVNLEQSTPNTPHKTPDILIVDDTPNNIRFLTKILLDHGYNVRKAINGQMGLMAARTVLPDVILLDIQMPDMTGYQVCEQLKQDEHTKSVPIIFISALDEIEGKVKAFQVGGSDYITKPFQVEEVLIRIQNQLTICQLQNQLRRQNEELKITLSSLQKAQNQLVQQEKMASLGELVASLAHEINNPISFIAGNIKPARTYVKDLLNLISCYQREYANPSQSLQNLIEEIDLEFLNSDLQKIMDSMQNGADRIRSVILALRIFSRLGESDVKAVDIHQGLDSTLMLLRYRLDAGKYPVVQLIKQYGNLPLVTCHASQINQVFLNLLSRALDGFESQFDMAGDLTIQPKIWIQTRLTDTNMVAIQIRDNGLPLEHPVQAALNQTNDTVLAGEGNLNIALLVCRQIIVETHGGKFTCQSNQTTGTIFDFEIPLHGLTHH